MYGAGPALVAVEVPVISTSPRRVPDPEEEDEEVEETLRERGRVGRRAWCRRWEAVGQWGVWGLAEGLLVRLLARLPERLVLALRMRPGLVVGLGKLLSEEKLRPLWVWDGLWGVLGGEGRSK